MAGFPSIGLNPGGSRNWNTPIVAGDKLFIGAGDSKVFTVLGAAGTANAGKVIEQHKLPTGDSQGFDLCGSIVSDGVVFTMLDGGGLYAFYGNGTNWTGGAIKINNGAPTTTSQVVTLSLDRGSNTNANEMIISEDPLFNGAAWVPYNTQETYTLSSGFGIKTVYVKYRDSSSGLESLVFNAQIDYIQQVIPTIIWSNPANITYGTALSSTQLNAKAIDPTTNADISNNGTFTYTPATGTVLSVGSNQPLHVDFTPNDATTYTNASKDVTINVTEKPIPVVGITLTPVTATNNVGTQHIVTATLKDPKGIPQPGINVNFVVDSGPNAGKHGSNTTDVNGEATFTYTGDGGVGTDTINASFVNQAGSTIFAQPVTKIWIKPANLPPVIQSVVLFPANTTAGSTINISANVTDDGTVTSVMANNTQLTLNNGIWQGSITAPSSLGNYSLLITAKDNDGNTASTTVPYSVVLLQGGASVSVIPKTSTVPIGGNSILLNIRIRNTENIDDTFKVNINLSGIPTSSQANLSWFDWTDNVANLRAGQTVQIPINVTAPVGTASGLKAFKAKVTSGTTKITGFDTGYLNLK